MEDNIEVFSTLGRIAQLHLGGDQMYSLSVAMQSEQCSPISGDTSGDCQNQELRPLALSPTVASVTKTGSWTQVCISGNPKIFGEKDTGRHWTSGNRLLSRCGHVCQWDHSYVYQL